MVVPQPASNTATPRITLPTRTATQGAAGTPTGDPTTALATSTVAATILTPGSDATAGPGGTVPVPGSDDPAPGGPAGEATPGLAPAALPGTAAPAAPGPGSSDAAGVEAERIREGLRRAGDGSVEGEAGADPSSGDSGPADAGPAGIVRVPVPDPRLRALWAAGGSPRAGQGLAGRLTADRPGPWGWWPFYAALVAAYGWALRRVWRAIRDIRALPDDEASGVS